MPYLRPRQRVPGEGPEIGGVCSEKGSRRDCSIKVKVNCAELRRTPEPEPHAGAARRSRTPVLIVHGGPEPHERAHADRHRPCSSEPAPDCPSENLLEMPVLMSVHLAG